MKKEKCEKICKILPARIELGRLPVFSLAAENKWKSLEQSMKSDILSCSGNKDCINIYLHDTSNEKDPEDKYFQYQKF
jgi:hypothetical protein